MEIHNFLLLHLVAANFYIYSIFYLLLLCTFAWLQATYSNSPLLFDDAIREMKYPPVHRHERLNNAFLMLLAPVLPSLERIAWLEPHYKRIAKQDIESRQLKEIVLVAQIVVVVIKFLKQPVVDGKHLIVSFSCLQAASFQGGYQSNSCCFGTNLGALRRCGRWDHPCCR